MATSPSTSYTGNDPRKIAQKQRETVGQQGDALQQQYADQYQQGQQQQAQTGGYLNGIEDPLAQGFGGYNPEEKSQILMTPEQQADIVSRAGMTAGAATAAGADAAQRAANAAGGNPAAVAAYRARAAQQAGSQAADATTNARIGASDAAAGRAAQVGNARLGQQNQGLNYYQGVQQMQNQNSQNAANRQLGAYGTQTSGGNQAAGLGVQASQTPSTFDKIIGGVAGALPAALSFLDEGDPASQSRPAVVAEGGPEAVMDMSAGGHDYLDEGSPDLGMPYGAEAYSVDGANPEASVSSQSWQKTPFWKQVGQNARNQMAQGPQSQPPMGSPQQQGGFNPVSTYDKIGKAAGTALNAFGGGGEMFGDSGMIFTEPTNIRMKPNEAAVPLSYRATAKTRPSMAMPLVNEIRKKKMYGQGA